MPELKTETGVPAHAANGRRNKKARLIVIIAVVIILALIGVVVAGKGLSSTSVPTKASVSDYSWEELSIISAEIAEANNETKAVNIAKNYNLTTPEGTLDGTQKKNVTFSTGLETEVQIAGFAHDNKTNGEKAGITFIFKEAIDLHHMNSSATNDGGWEDSDMRSWLASDLFDVLPEDLKSSIVAVDKLTNNVGMTDNPNSVTATSDKLWLFSPRELYGNISWYSNELMELNTVLNREGAEYKLFKDSGVIISETNYILSKLFDGNPVGWWERSPRPDSSNCFGYESEEGKSTRLDADHELGVVPGFCI